MIWFTEIGSKDVIFQLLDRELPEEIEFPTEAVLNKIRYPGGHQSNQTIGIYRGEVEWSGTFFGTYRNAAGQLENAKQRAEALKSLVGRPLRVGFPVPGHETKGIPGLTTHYTLTDEEFTGGFKGVYIVEKVIEKVKNYLHVDYTIHLVPHERQEKIKPTKTNDVRVKVVTTNLTSGISGVAKNEGPKKPLDKAKAAADANAKAVEAAAPDVYKAWKIDNPRNLKVDAYGNIYWESR